MPNLLNKRLDAHKKHTSAGFTAGVWTLSGVVLAACGIFDDDGGGGNTLHVQRSPVQGARIYFDMNNDGVIDATDEAMQDAVFPQGFVTDAAGRAHNIPAVFQDLPFKAVLDGAIDADTGAPLSGALHSIPDANGAHRLTSPITDLLADADKTPEEMARALLPHADSDEITRILEAINNPRNYLGGDDGVEGFAFFLAKEQEEGRTPTPTDSAVQSKAAQYLTDSPTDNPTDPGDTLIIVNEDADTDTAFIDLPAKTIGAHDAYVATIQAVSHAGGVNYRFVEADGIPADVSDFNIDSQGIISFIGENPTTTTLHIEVSNGDATESEIVRVAITVADAPTVDELPAGAESATIMENVVGAAGGTALIEGITTSATNPTWKIGEANPAGLSAIMDKFEIVSGTGITYNLVLKTGASLDYETIPRGVLNLHLWAQENGVRSNPLELRIRVEQDPDEVAFSGGFTGIVAEDGNGIAQGTISVENQDSATATATDGTYGTLALDDGRWIYTLINTNSAVNALRAGEALIDIATITLSSGESQNIIIRINGADEDVHFLNDTGTRTADASVDVEFGNPVLVGVDIFDGLTLTNANLADIAVKFADTGESYNLFTITNAGLLTFIGTNEDVANFGDSITLNLQITAPTLTTATLPFALQVNVVNAVDDGRTAYEIVGDVEVGQILRVQEVQGSSDPDGVISDVGFQWFRGDENVPTLLRTGETYRVTQADIDSGDSIGVFAIYTDGSGATYTHRDNDDTTTIAVFATPVKFTSPAINARTINLAEDTSATSTVHFNVQATSSDNSGPVDIATYMFIDDTDTATTRYRGFTINPSSGAITLTGSLDFEDTHRDGSTINLRVRATDANAETADITLTVNLSDVNEHAPAFVTNADDSALTDGTEEIAEDAANGDRVGLFRATDADGTNNEITYTLDDGGVGVFGIRAVTGTDNWEIYVADNTNLDFDGSTKSYTIRITASDSDPDTTARMSSPPEAVTITLSDVNDIVPTYTTSGAPSVRTTSDAAVDPLTSDTATGYSITITDADTNNQFAGNFDLNDNRFAFQETSAGNGVWELVLLANQDITEAAATAITLTYQVHDGDNTAATPGSVDINVVESSVRFNAGMGTQTIRENEYDTANAAPITLATTTPVATVAATSITPSAVVRYAITGGADMALFTIADSSSGAISLVNPLPLNHEMKDSYEVVVTATDSITTNTAIAHITIEVINNQEGDGTYVIEGNVAAGGRLNAVVTDPDGTQSITYEWYSLAAAGGGRQTLGATQSITLATDADLTRTYHVDITHTDNLDDAHTETLQASAVQFGEDSYSLDIFEGENNPLPDIDAVLTGATLTYAFLTNPATGATSQTSGIFTIDAGSGAISLTDSSAAPLDYETAQTHNLTVRATETGGNQASGDVEVTINVRDLNEHDPEIVGGATATASISEDAGLNAMVTDVDASDDDPTNTLSYAITSGNIGDVFFIDPTSGVITVNGALNRETTASYDLVVTVTDDGVDNTDTLDEKTATQTITVAIGDINDSDPTWTTGNAPNFAERAAVASDTPTGFSITLSDDDTDAVNEHNVIVVGTHASRFKFIEDGTTANQWNLVLIAGQGVDREVDDAMLTIEYQVMDGTRFTSTPPSNVGITIDDINDNGPTVTVAQTVAGTNGMIDERISGNTAAIVATGITITLADADATSAHQSVTPTSTPKPQFKVYNDDDPRTENTDFEVVDDGGNWVLRLKAGEALDHTASPLSLKIGVSDGAHDEYITPTAFTVTINNLQEGPAVFEVNPTQANEKILEVEVDTADPDGLDGMFSFQWFTTTDNGITQTDISGEVGREFNTTGRTDPEDTVYGVRVEYTDHAGTVYSQANGNAPFAVNTTLRFTSSYSITLTDGNANPTLPTFALELNNVAVTTGAKYTFATNGDPHNFFTLSEAGVLTLDRAVDFDTATAAQKSFNLLIVATASSGETALAMIPVTVMDANDSNPSITAADDTRTAMGVLVDDVVDSDPGVSFKIMDADSNAENTFDSAITSTTHPSLEDRFTLIFDTSDPKAKTAKLALKPNMKIDREELGNTDTISLNVKVKDGQATSTDGVAVTITFTDINDNAPTMTTSGTASLTEEMAGIAGGTKTGFSITLADKDSDAVNQHDIRVTGDLASRFGFVKNGTTPNQWNLVLLEGKKVDRDPGGDGASLTIAYTITDDPHPPITDSVTVNIIDTNDNPPKFAQSTYTLSVREDAGLDDKIGAPITAMDPDVGMLFYDIINDPGALFEVDNNGQITVSGYFDYETTKSYSVTLEADDGVHDFATATIIINVGDINDNQPTLTVVGTGALQQLPASETATDTGISFTLDDADKTANPPVTEGFFTVDDDRFDVVSDGSGGWKLVLLAGKTVTYDADNPGIYPQVDIYDWSSSGEAADPMMVTIAIAPPPNQIPIFADNPLSWGALVLDNGVLPEDTYDGDHLATINASDPDGNYGNVLEFRIVGGDGTFSITDDTLILNKPLDYETTQSYQLTLRVLDDDGGFSDTDPITINIGDVNDNGPTVTVAQAVAGTDGAIDERVAGETAAIIATGITITLADADTIEAHKSIAPTSYFSPLFRVLNAADDMENTDFDVVYDNGNWVLQYTGTTLSAESGDGTIALKIEVSDDENTPPDVSDAFTLNINNLDEGEATYIVSGNVAAGAELTATLAPNGADPDGLVGTATYRWFRKSSTDADPSALDAPETASFSWLAPASATHTHTLGALVDGAVYGVAVQYLDGYADGITPKGAATVVTARALALEFAQTGGYSATIKEDGTSLTALDIDAVLNDPNITENISYAFVTDADTGATDTAHLGFTIDASDGTISFTGTAGTDLDYESITNNPIPLTVRATHDNGYNNIPNPSGDIMVSIAVNDVNEFAPVFVTPTMDTTLIGDSANVAEDVAMNYRVGLFRATDADGDNNVVGYTLAGGGDVFDVRAVTGNTDNNWEIYVVDTANLDFDAGSKTYNLVITASDSANTPMTETKPVRITITDANDNAPQYVNVDDTALTTTATVDERTSGNTAPIDILTFRFNDEDTAGVNPTILASHFTVLDASNVEDTRFDVVADGQNWKLRLKATAELDFEATETLDLRISMNDQTHTARSDLITLTINNIDDGPAIYAIDPTASATGGHHLALEVSTPDPDGVDTNFPITYQWFTTTDDGVTKTPLATDADGASYTLKMGDSTTPDYGVTVRYTDISGKNEVVDSALITLHPLIATGSGAVEENDQGADTGITLSAGNGYTIGGDDEFSFFDSEGEEDDRFEVVNEAGAWKLKLKSNVSLDAEQATRINLRIVHNNGAVVPVDVQVAVDNVNDVAPDFTEETYRGRNTLPDLIIYEGDQIGVVIHEYEIVEDVGADDFLFYFESTGNLYSEDRKFMLVKETRVDEETGREQIFLRVEVAQVLDYEEYTRIGTNPREVVVVQIKGTSLTDNGVLRTTIDDSNIRIYILNRNDTPPELELPDGTNSAVAQVDENTDGANVALNIMFKASDLDDSTSLLRGHQGHNLPLTEFTFTISGDQAYKFEITENRDADYRWQLKLKDGHSLDYERADTLNLQITASDGVNTSAPILVTINVNDDASESNTHNPYFIGGVITLDVFEDIAVGVRIATLTALDGDDGDTLTYSILAGNERGLFALDANTGALTIAKTLDYETAITHTLMVQVADGNSKTDRVEVAVNVLDVSPETPAPADTTPGVNDIIPMFTRAIGSPIYGVIDETGGNAEDVSTGYKIRIIDADSNNNFTFDFNDNRFKFVDQGEGIWELFLKSGSAVDYDMVGGESIALDFLINDGVNNAGRRGAVNVRVNDIDDHAPIFTISGTGQIDEQISTQHDAVYAGITFTISDMDTGIGTNSPLFFQVNNPYQDRFELVQDGDTLKLYLKADAVLDYESEATINGLTITVANSPHPRYTSPAGAVTLHVQNKDDGDALYQVNGASTAIGNTLTLQKITDDPDGIKAGTLAYQWFTTTDGGATKNPLATNANGISYTLQTGDSTTAVYGVTISYTDNADTQESVDVLFGLTASAQVGTVTENDRGADTGITLSFDGSYSGIDSDSFIITGRDGAVDNRFEVVNESNAWKLKLKSNTSLDAEQATKINLNIALNDVSVDVQVAVNNVNDVIPEFTNETYRGQNTLPDLIIYEGDQIGTFIHEYEITEDVGAEDFLFYFESTGNLYSEDRKFMLVKETRVDEETGREQIFLRVELAQELDYEEYTRIGTNPREVVVVQIKGTSLTDNGVLRTTIDDSNIRIYILNRNDTPPELELRDGTNSAVAQVDENTDGANVALNIMFKASDLDDSTSLLRGHQGHNLPLTEFTFTISGDQAHKFEVVASGDTDYAWQLNLKSGQSLDYERAATLNLQITASDGINTSAPLEITINVNDNATETNPHNPYFTNDSITLDVHENIAVNTQIATLTALDGDDGDGDTLTYAITAGNTNTQFAIDQNTGILTIAKSLDHETTPTHKLTIQANDGNGKTEEIIATINVLDIDEDPAEDLGLTPIPDTDPNA